LHRYYGAGYSHFITTSCYQRLPLLGTPRTRDLLVEVLEQVRRRYRFVLLGYVVMPEHLHLLINRAAVGKSVGRDAGDQAGICTAAARAFAQQQES